MKDSGTVSEKFFLIVKSDHVFQPTTPPIHNYYLTMNHHHHHNTVAVASRGGGGGGRTVTGMDAARANDYFEHFLNASSLKNILGYYRSICDLLNLKPNQFPHFYPKLRGYLTSWKAKALWKKFDARAAHKCYGKGKLCTGTRVLIIGGGPCGLRTAIEAQLLGAKVVVVEKRDRLSRNNVLHLWPFVIEDLRSLGAKKFFGKFCAGAIDHISIRQLQCILLKVVLLLGVEVHTEVSFERLVEPDEKTGWRAEFTPSTHPVGQYEFDVVIGADGKRNTLQGFKRKEFRGKLAIAITANFINKRTEAEARVEEISGVAFIFNQKFFKDLHEDTGIDLENIVYYKDDTHYFVMTAKKASLIEKGVIRRDLADTERLLAPDNVDREALMEYAREAANFSTTYQMPDLEFAVNHYGQPDVAMFDFTSMYAAENASKVVERAGYRLLMILVGDSLLEPFWPTGSGCARGFLSSLDAAWAIRSWCSGTMNPLDVIAERESIYRLLGQTTPDNLNKDWKAYTLDPATRYPNLNKNMVMPHQTSGLFDTDNPKSVERMRRHSQDVVEVPKKRRKGNVDNEELLNWISEQVREHEDITVGDLASVFRDGKVLCAILNHYRPDLVDYSAVKEEEPAKMNQIAMDVLEKEIGIPPIMTGEELTNTEDYLAMATYLTQVYHSFRCEIPHIKHPKLELPDTKRSDPSVKCIKVQQQFQQHHKVVDHHQHQQQPPPRPSSRHKRHAVDPLTVSRPSQMEKKTRKRRTLEKIGASVDHENKLPQGRGGGGGGDEDFAARIKSLEEKWREPQPVEKKPRDLLRAIGKIETSDWNIKEIEKKIRENKLGKPANSRDKEKVPKWSKEQFIARQTKMEKQHLDRQDSAEAKYADIDKNIKHLDLKLKEGNSRDLGQNKVASITEKLASKVPSDQEQSKPVQRSQSRPVMLPSQNASEFCHFCRKRVYLMERLSAEGRFFHHGCFKCQYCHTQLRLGSYAFDRDGMYDHKFFCIHHYGMQGEMRSAATPMKTTATRKQQQHRSTNNTSSIAANNTEKKTLGGIAGVDLLDRVRTPERVEFANLSVVGNQCSDHEEYPSQMDEDEWTDKNFGASAAEVGSSDEDESSSLSDTDSDDEEAYEEALEEPATKEGTLKWAERFNRRYSKKRDDSESDGYSSSDQSSYYENTTDDEDSDTATEGEEEIRARELRKQEVRVEPPLVQTDTGTDTEIVSDESTSDSSSSSEIRNSATEISTDSEFAHDDPTPTREVPFSSLLLNDVHVTKSRGSGHRGPRKIQVTTGYLQRPSDKVRAPTTTTPNTNTITTTTTTTTKQQEIKLNLTPLVPSAPSLITSARKPIILRTGEGYALNRTQSTGGIAAKVSLELKKKYLLGESVGPGSIQKSGSASTLDDKLKSFHTNISDCQKLLRPAAPDTVVSKVVQPEPPQPPEVVINEPEGRPRSPVHETSIIVPNIDWNNSKKKKRSSLSDSGPEFNFDSIPTVRVEEVPFDSLGDVHQVASSVTVSTESVKSVRKTLNQPKPLPQVEASDVLPEIHDVLHVRRKSDSEEEEATAALTETELSDWARDGAVSDDLGNDDDFLEPTSSRGERKPKTVDLDTGTRARMAEFEDLDHICGKEESRRSGGVIAEALNHGLVDIEFMDTGTETSSEDGVVDDSQNGYVLFKDEEDLAEDSLDLGMATTMVEARNEVLTRNTGYCVLAEDNFGGEVVDLKPSDVEHLMLKSKMQNEPEEDSLLIVDTGGGGGGGGGGGTTTEENTCSDSTVKNLTEISADNNNFQRKRLEEKLAKLKAEQAAKHQDNNVEFDEHCHRLRSRGVEFGNAKDSIDVRKSRRKSKSDSPPKPDLVLQEQVTPPASPQVQQHLVRTPDVLYKKEEIEKERDVNQKLVQEMVMNKMKASLERKQRKRGSRSFELSKSATTDAISNDNNNHQVLPEEKETSRNSEVKSVYATPDVLLSTLKTTTTTTTTPNTVRPVSVHVVMATPPTALRENPSLPDVRKALFFTEDFHRPVAPPRLKQEARARAQQMSNQELGLSPEEKLSKLRDKLGQTPSRTKSSGEIAASVKALDKFCKSDPNLLLDTTTTTTTTPTNDKKNKKKNGNNNNNKDRERRKSITKLFTTFFTKKSPSSGQSRGLFSRISPKAKDVSKDVLVEEPVTRRKSFSELRSAVIGDGCSPPPPPVPPLPLNYTIRGTDDSCSEGEHEWRRSGGGGGEPSSCDTLDQSVSSTSNNRTNKSARRAARQAQLKRHRMAQEIQRKLEETEVKTRELEERGVLVEKGLRGEDGCYHSREESELLQEWFDLMRDRTELRRYERELMVRAQELELEDRHARLQHELRERLENDERKTEQEVELEGSIINEMMEIVAKRDSLIALLEEDRLRYSNEDRDFEEQMLAKGLRLTPIRKTPEK